MSASTEQIYEQTLVLRAQIGDEAAFRELVILHGPRLLHFTERMMQGACGQVADLTQDIWLAIYKGLPRLIDPARFRSWAFRIARDRIYQEYRKRKLHTLPLDEMADCSEASDEKSPPWEELRECLMTLSPEHREALVLRFFEEMSYEEIARITAASIGTVRSRIFYAKQALRHAWETKPL